MAVGEDDAGAAAAGPIPETANRFIMVVTVGRIGGFHDTETLNPCRPTLDSTVTSGRFSPLPFILLI